MDFITPLTEPVSALLTSVCMSFALLLIEFANISLGHVPLFSRTFHSLHITILEATEKGMGASLACYLVSILNGTSVFG
jgi:hypothetical protein